MSKKFEREREFLAQREVYVGIPLEEQDVVYLCEQITLLKDALRSTVKKFNVLMAENDRLKRGLYEESLADMRERYHARKRGNGADVQRPDHKMAE